MYFQFEWDWDSSSGTGTALFSLPIAQQFIAAASSRGDVTGYYRPCRENGHWQCIRIHGGMLLKPLHGCLSYSPAGLSGWGADLHHVPRCLKTGSLEGGAEVALAVHRAGGGASPHAYSRPSGRPHTSAHTCHMQLLTHATCSCTLRSSGRLQARLLYV